MTINTTTSYIDAEVRGRLRQWKAELNKGYGVVGRLLDGQGALADREAFCLRGSPTGRQRAFSRISRTLASAGATLEGVRIDGRAPIAVWSMLKRAKASPSSLRTRRMRRTA
jgi:5-enolpyruvylshikimate-3-phosphate synthase